jgi:hypothetical protein
MLESGMRTRSKAIIVLVVIIAFAVMTFIPFIPGPNAVCGAHGPGGPLCIPNQKLSITQTYLGFGSESSYSGKSYYLCGLSNIEALTHLQPC